MTSDTKEAKATVEGLLDLVDEWVASRLAGQGEQPAPAADDEQAPPNSLPSWQDCSRIIGNAEFRKRAAEGMEGSVLDTPPTTPEPTALHRFIYEYDDADPYRSAWFLHRLELVIKECAALNAPASPAGEPRVRDCKCGGKWGDYWNTCTCASPTVPGDATHRQGEPRHD